jgi:hypothetical protein
VSKLGSNACQKQTSQAVAIDDRNAGGCKPANEAKSNNREILPQPISIEAVHPNLRGKNTYTQLPSTQTVAPKTDFLSSDCYICFNDAKVVFLHLFSAKIHMWCNHSEEEKDVHTK